LRSTRQRKTLLEDIEDATIVLDHQNRLVCANRTAQDVFDTGPEYTGMSADDLFDSIIGEHPDRIINMNDSETEIAIAPDDERRYFSVSASTVGDNERGCAFVLHKITAQNSMKYRLNSNEMNLRLSIKF
jgi:nitrogen fixation/metabolism regulation signal transduction histidine kinase